MSANSSFVVQSGLFSIIGNSVFETIQNNMELNQLLIEQEQKSIQSGSIAAQASCQSSKNAGNASAKAYSNSGYGMIASGGIQIAGVVAGSALEAYGNFGSTARNLNNDIDFNSSRLKIYHEEEPAGIQNGALSEENQSL